MKSNITLLSIGFKLLFKATHFRGQQAILKKNYYG